jgi:hypothetical protein
MSLILLYGLALRGPEACSFQMATDRYKNRDFSSRSRSATPACYRCGSNEHSVWDCKAPKHCYRCGSEQHEARTCSQSKYYKCGKTGHMRIDCPENRSRSSSPNDRHVSFQGAGGRGQNFFTIVTVQMMV